MKKIIIALVLIAAGLGGAVINDPSLLKDVMATSNKPHTLPHHFGAYVLSTADGRSMAISVNNELYSLRVKDIDLPTTEDALHESDLALRTLVFGRNIVVENATLAADGVYEGQVIVGPDDVGKVQVSAGLALAAPNNTELVALQESAKRSKIGMWSANEAANAVLASDQSNTPQALTP